MNDTEGLIDWKRGTTATMELAEDHEWTGSFIEARNFAVSEVSNLIDGMLLNEIFQL